VSREVLTLNVNFGKLPRMRKIQIGPKDKCSRGRKQWKQVRIADEQHKRLVAVGKRTGRSLTELINIAVEAIE
jgi:hypothetical protein